MIYLALSIFCSSLIFVIFKGFQKFKIDNFQAIIVNYFVASSLGWILGFDSISNAHPEDWILICVLIGAIFISLFILMAKVSQDLGVSTASVSVKMSVVIPVVIGMLLYGDKLSFQLTLGILLSLAAIFLITQKESGFHFNHIKWPIVLFVGNGLLDSVLKYAQTHYVQSNDVSLFSASCFGLAAVAGMIAFPFLKQKSALKKKNIIAGVVLGVPNFGSIYFLIMTLESTNMKSSIFFPINNIGIVLLSTVLSVLIFKEGLNRKNIIGIAIGVLSILLITI
jgi:drug/metabolite transporter (DMT)-like permease